MNEKMEKVMVLQKLINDAERRIGSYVASQQNSDDPYIKKQSEKIKKWHEQIESVLADEM